jgi:hypothetical protein
MVFPFSASVTVKLFCSILFFMLLTTSFHAFPVLFCVLLSFHFVFKYKLLSKTNGPITAHPLLD